RGCAAAVATVAVLGTAVAGCGSSKSSSSPGASGGATTSATKSVSGTISFDGVWSGAEQKAFQDVINTFNKQYPNVSVNYKSTVWYNVHAFKNAGVSPPSTWPEFIKDAKTLKASGVPAYSIGGADGWTLTDLFENIYLRQAGLHKYEALAAHKMKWTDPSVKQ